MVPPHQACVRIDGAIVDPASVVSGPADSAHPQHAIEVRLSAKVLLHELQECGVAVSEQTLRGFLSSDAHDERARAAYLAIAHSAVTGSTGRTPIPGWRWTGNSDVQLEDGVITFSGTAIDA